MLVNFLLKIHMSAKVTVIHAHMVMGGDVVTIERLKLEAAYRVMKLGIKNPKAQNIR